MECVSSTLLSTLDDLPGHNRTKIGVITYDSAVHFYNLKASLSQPQMLVVPEVNEIFLPQLDDLLVNLQDSKGIHCPNLFAHATPAVIKTLIQKLPSMFQSSKSVDAATAAALKAAYGIMVPDNIDYVVLAELFVSWRVVK